jgi:hypothetical protein
VQHRFRLRLEVNTMTFWVSTGPPDLAPLSVDEQIYLLVDGAQVERLSIRLAGLPVGFLQESLFPQPLAPDRFDATPHLLQPTGFDSARALIGGALGRAMAFHGALSYLVSPLSIEALARRLRTRLDAVLPDDYECINRYFDARISPALYECLNVSQRREFFSVCSQWWVLSHQHQWESLPCVFSEEDPFQAPLRLNSQQQAAMMDAAYPYTVIEHFEQTDPELLDDVAPAQRYTQIAQALRRAHAYGIDGGPDAVLFCTLVLTRGSGFEHEPAWAAALNRVKLGEITLQQALKAQHD